jgi:hypothetical protein
LKAVNSFAFPIPPKYQRGQFAADLQDAHRLSAKWKRDDKARALRNSAQQA